MKPANKPDKALRDKLLTVYGRNPVLEALGNTSLDIFRLHMAKSNRDAPVINDILSLARERNIEILKHERLALSRISGSARQDQGVALDIIMKDFHNIESFLVDKKEKQLRLIALDNITNPQNVGMVIRSVTASGIDGVIIPKKGCAKIDSLVIKASAGTVFKSTIIRCEELETTITTIMQSRKTDCCVLSSRAKENLFNYTPENSTVFVLGNETHGVSKRIASLCNKQLYIPMRNGVESLNIAAAATLAGFHLAAN